MSLERPNLEKGQKWPTQPAPLQPPLSKPPFVGGARRTNHNGPSLPEKNRDRGVLIIDMVEPQAESDGGRTVEIEI